MDRDQALELLRDTHQFPGVHIFKIIGVADDDFADRVIAAVASVVVVDPSDCSTRRTPAGRHIAVTLEPTVSSAEQVLEVYAALREVQGVVLTL